MLRKTHLAAAMSLLLLLGSTTFAVDRAAHFGARCTGDQEVPPVDTRAVSVAHMNVFRIGDRAVMMTIRIDFGLSSAFRAAHIHRAPAGENGPVVVTFGPPDFEQRGLAFSFDVHTQTDGGEPIAALVELMRSGNAYVNVHTENFPTGEVRGQIRGRR